MQESLSPNETFRLAPMRPWPLPKGMTRAQFNDLVSHLSDLLTAEGLDPSCNLSVGDFDEIAGGKTRPRFALFISEAAAKIIERKSN